MPKALPLPSSLCDGRFTVVRLLGSGGMGSVYVAHDHNRHSDVALKVMRRATGSWVFRFKNEFRNLAGVVHPNLVTLHDLVQSGDDWMFTMELVPGVTFSEARRIRSSDARGSETDPADSVRDTAPVREPNAKGESNILANVHQISDALRQLCDGVDHLHRLGIVHGDIKPSNALITPDGRVVILDFGISRHWLAARDDGEAGLLMGTPGFLAPERLRGGPATPASDLYALGVTLFETLTGRALAGGIDAESTLVECRPALAVDDATSVLFRRLESVCLRLIHPSSEQRPSPSAVREELSLEPQRAGRRAFPLRSRSKEVRPHFVARQRELDLLRRALEDGGPAQEKIIFVTGESGIGKSALMRRLLDDDWVERFVVLEGKCYEREQVPYRALDRLVDALSSRLLRVDPEAIRALSWVDLVSLARMFPALHRVKEFDAICRKIHEPDTRDAQRRRRAASTVLAQLLALVAKGRRILLFIDDLHWGDEESADVLRELFLESVDLDLRIVACHRLPLHEGVFVARFLGATTPLRSLELRLDALGLPESETLARALLGPAAASTHVSRVAEEAGGNPFLIQELVEFAGATESTGRALDSAIVRHVQQLPVVARDVVEVLSVAGRRLDIGLLRLACGTDPTFEAALILLRGHHLIKASDLQGEWLEPYHDRVRQAVVEGLSGEVIVARHRALIAALEGRDAPDPAWLAFHLEAAGDLERAAVQLLAAAHNAELALAPLAAAAHFERLATLVPPYDPRRAVALRGQASNLAAAGRAARAGEIYLQVAELASSNEALALRSHAARAWVSAGEFDKAKAVLWDVLDAAGARLPRHLPGLLWMALRDRAWAWWNRDRFAVSTSTSFGADRVLRVDALEIAAELYASIDLLRSFVAHTARFRESLRLGEPRRIARALADEVVMGSIGGERVSKRGLALLSLAASALGNSECREERALLKYALGVHHVLNGRYIDVVETLAALSNAPDLLGYGTQLRTVRAVLGYSRWWLGQWDVGVRDHRQWIQDAVERGDRFSAVSHRLEQVGQWGAVLDDQPTRGRDDLAEALASPIARDLSFEHIAAKQTRAWLALYVDEPAEAERALRFDARQRPYLRVQRTRAEVFFLRASAALAKGRSADHDARRWQSRLEREALHWAQPLIRLIAASRAAREGRDGEAISQLSVCASLCEQQGLRMFSAAAHWRLGQLEGGDGGTARKTAALNRVRDEGARNPERIVRALAPGFRD